VVGGFDYLRCVQQIRVLQQETFHTENFSCATWLLANPCLQGQESVHSGNKLEDSKLIKGTVAGVNLSTFFTRRTSLGFQYSIFNIQYSIFNIQSRPHPTCSDGESGSEAKPASPSGQAGWGR
jgi:hypothetical protein